jgi:hypothetical protein
MLISPPLLVYVLRVLLLSHVTTLHYNKPTPGYKDSALFLVVLTVFW